MTQELDRLARAAHEGMVAARPEGDRLRCVSWDSLNAENRKSYRTEVRAVLTAMRDEPSEGAVEAGCLFDMRAKAIFQTMLNHYLSEGGQS